MKELPAATHGSQGVSQIITWIGYVDGLTEQLVNNCQPLIIHSLIMQANST